MQKVLRGLIVGILLLAGSTAPAGANSMQGASACQALFWLRTQQLPDGSFGLRLANGGYQPSASVTADAVYALALMGEQPDGPRWTVNGQSALDALARLAKSYVGADAGQAGKVGRAVAVAGGDPHAFGGLDLIDIINAAYNPTTGRYHPTLLFRHTLAVEALLRAGEPAPANALTTVLAAQLPDGGWFWSFDATQSDVDSTGRVLQLFGLAGVRDTAVLTRAAAYLEKQQAAEGGWGVGYLAGPANANSTALAVGGLWAAGRDPQAASFQRNGLGAVDTLLSFQESSGAFVYIRQPGKEEVRLMATLDVLTALARPLAGKSACQTAYLPILLFH